MIFFFLKKGDNRADIIHLFFNQFLYFLKKDRTLDRITLRLRPAQRQIIEELREALGCNTAVIVRAIISDFLTRNEDILERIVSEYQNGAKPLMEDLNLKEDED